MAARENIRIELLFERDLRKMTGFWQHSYACGEHSFVMQRSQLVSDVVSNIVDLTGVPKEHMACFVLHYRNNPRQVRFAFAPFSTTFSQHIPTNNAPHFSASDPHLALLCIFSQGYVESGLLSWSWQPLGHGEVADELARWKDDQCIMLIFKYCCLKKGTMVTLGCMYINTNEKLGSLVEASQPYSVISMLQPYIDSGEVDPLPRDSESWACEDLASVMVDRNEVAECWEEFNESDIQSRDINRSIKSEQLWSGDILIWMPRQERYSLEQLRKVGKKRMIKNRDFANPSKYARTVFKDRKFTDFVIKCNDRSLDCHRCMLAAASPVFERMFEAGMVESSRCQADVSESAEVMESVLEYIYTGRMPSARLDEVLSVADRYEIKQLFDAVLSEVTQFPVPETIVPVIRALRPLKEREQPKRAWKLLLRAVGEREDLREAVFDAV